VTLPFDETSRPRLCLVLFAIVALSHLVYRSHFADLARIGILRPKLL
jgi:hypothetical protein